jgi:hypothetical protein
MCRNVQVHTRTCHTHKTNKYKQDHGDQTVYVLSDMRPNCEIQYKFLSLFIVAADALIHELLYKLRISYEVLDSMCKATQETLQSFYLERRREISQNKTPTDMKVIAKSILTL